MAIALTQWVKLCAQAQAQAQAKPVKSKSATTEKKEYQPKQSNIIVNAV